MIEGHLYAEVKSRGTGLPERGLFTLSVPVMDWLKMNAKLWRNEVFGAGLQEEGTRALTRVYCGIPQGRA